MDERRCVRSARLTATALFGVGLLTALSACGSSPTKQGSTVSPPKPGRAVEIGVPPPEAREIADVHDDTVFGYGTLDLPDGMILTTAAGSAGTFTPGPKVVTLVEPQNRTFYESAVQGYARTADGTIYLGWNGAVCSGRSPQLMGFTAVIPNAGTASICTVPSDTATAPSIPPGKSVFGEAPTPIGVRPDGSVLIIDGPTLWALKGGRLTRAYQASLTPDAQQRTVTSLGSCGAVDSQGTAWLSPSFRGSQELGDVFGLTASGTKVPLALPNSIPGVAWGPAILHVASLTPDGHGGLYVRAGEAADQYVLHIANGQGTVVAASHLSIEQQEQSQPKMSGAVDALKIPLYLPSGIVVRGDKLILIGSADYVIEVGLPQ